MVKQKIIETKNIRDIQIEIDNGWRVVQMISQSVSIGSQYGVGYRTIIVLLEKTEIDVPFSKFKDDERYDIQNQRTLDEEDKITYYK